MRSQYAVPNRIIEIRDTLVLPKPGSDMPKLNPFFPSFQDDEVRAALDQFAEGSISLEELYVRMVRRVNEWVELCDRAKTRAIEIEQRNAEFQARQARVQAQLQRWEEQSREPLVSEEHSQTG